MPLSSPWLEARLSGITGTDAAAILGLTPAWRTPLQVWAEKTGRITPEDLGDIERIQWGNLLEPVVVAETLRRTGRTSAQVRDWDALLPGGHVETFDHGDERKSMIFSDRWPWLRTTPDALMPAWSPLPWMDSQREESGPGIGEAKAVGIHAKKDWRDTAPIYYQAQVATNCLAAGLSWGTFGALIGGQELRIFDYNLDQSLGEKLIARLEAFWVQHILGGVPPDPTASDRDRQILERLYPERRELPAVELDGGLWGVLDRELARLDTERAELRQRERELKARQSKIENEIRAAMQSAPRAVIPSGTVYELQTVRRDAYTVKATSFRQLSRKAQGESKS